jgi:ABC-type uncharacterized transport system permease subunit
MFEFERKSQPLLPRREFLTRVAASALFGLGMVAVSLLAGMLGYHFLEKLGWLDAFLNAAMLLGGMGPLEQPRTGAGKLFAGLYSLYAGLAVLVIAGVVFAPIFHRFLHRFHLEEGKGTDGEEEEPRKLKAKAKA